MDRAGLYGLLDTYLRALVSRDAKAVRWADAPRNSENNVMLEVDDGLWGTIDALGEYQLRFARLGARRLDVCTRRDNRQGRVEGRRSRRPQSRLLLHRRSGSSR